MAIKLNMQNAKYKNAKVILYFLNFGSKIVAITTDVIPLKNKSKVEIMILFEFVEVIVQKSAIVYHSRRIKVSHPCRVKVNHLRRAKVNH